MSGDHLPGYSLLQGEKDHHANCTLEKTSQSIPLHRYVGGMQSELSRIATLVLIYPKRSCTLVQFIKLPKKRPCQLIYYRNICGSCLEIKVINICSLEPLQLAAFQLPMQRFLTSGSASGFYYYYYYCQDNQASGLYYGVHEFYHHGPS